MAPSAPDASPRDTALRDTTPPADLGASPPPAGHPLGGMSRVKARLVKNGLGFTEGPVWVTRGPFVESPALLFTASKNIQRLVLPDTTSVVEANAGANGLAIDDMGRLYACRGARVTRTTAAGTVDKTWTGFGNANDVVVREDGTIYVTNFQRTPGALRIPTGGNPTPIAAADSNSNGIALSPDGRTLYIVVSATAKRVDRFPLGADGTPGQPSTVARVTGIWADGMAVDDAGNLYVTSSIDDKVGIVEVFSPAGMLLGTIEVGPKVTNCTFGGADRKTLFITASGALYAADLAIPGRP